MKLPDVNILLYAYDSNSPRHGAAKGWFEEQLSGVETIAFTWSVVLAFLRLATSPRVFERPLSPEDAFEIVERWLGQPCATVVHPTERHLATLRDLLAPFGTAGNLTTDAHLAALSIEHGAELCSADADFSRFAGVRWVDPLAVD